MPFRRRREDELTGGDYLVAVASRSAENGLPFAAEFLQMIQNSFDEEELLWVQPEAQRPLREHEAAPAGVIMAAAKKALDDGDEDALEEIVWTGLALLAKWPEYLAGIGRHPVFALPGRD